MKIVRPRAPALFPLVTLILLAFVTYGRMKLAPQTGRSGSLK
jgi:hypothetical protein